MSRATDSKSHRKTHSENHSAAAVRRRRRRRRITGSASRHCPHRRTDTVAIIYKIARKFSRIDNKKTTWGNGNVVYTIINIDN
jgi:hypothetical protein